MFFQLKISKSEEANVFKIHPLTQAMEIEEAILVSACLVGMNCKWDSTNNENQRVIAFLKEKCFVPVCPEQLGGLPTPREYCELKENGKIVSKAGANYTKNYKEGARETVKIAKLCGCTKAILKDGSPSCGANIVGDESKESGKRKGQGVAAQALRSAGIVVVSERELEKLE